LRRAPSVSIVVSPLFAPFVLVLDVAALDVNVAVSPLTPKAPRADRGVEQHDDQCQTPDESFFQLDLHLARHSNHRASMQLVRKWCTRFVARLPPGRRPGASEAEIS
jgi:hypothetical protein